MQDLHRELLSELRVIRDATSRAHVMPAASYGHLSMWIGDSGLSGRFGYT